MPISKQEIEQFLVRINLGEDCAFKMKIFKDGALVRQGMGSVPELALLANSPSGGEQAFQQLLALVPDALLESGGNYEEPEVKVPLEYMLGFYAHPTNNERGDAAQFANSQGFYFRLDNNTEFRHPILAFIDHFAMQAAQLTNRWYFCALVHATQAWFPIGHPEGSTVAIPPTPDSANLIMTRYLQQLYQTGWHTDLQTQVKDLLFRTPEGILMSPQFHVENDTLRLDFITI